MLFFIPNLFIERVLCYLCYAEEPSKYSNIVFIYLFNDKNHERSFAIKGSNNIRLCMIEDILLCTFLYKYNSLCSV